MTISASSTTQLRRAVRFARSLAFVSGGAMIGCGGPAGSSTGGAPLDAAATGPTQNDENETGAPGDAAPFSDAQLAEAGDARGDGAPSLPTCADDEDEVRCMPGNVCHVETTYGSMRCDAPDAGINKPCGQIACGWLCACKDPSTSTCQCYADSGPLPPPDLPSA